MKPDNRPSTGVFVRDTGGSVPLKIAPMIIFGLSLLVLVIMFLTTV